MAGKMIPAEEWLWGRFKRRFSKRQWMSLFGGHPIPLGGGAAPAPAFSPADIGGLKMWLDFSDLTTLFQDTAMTSPVTTDGQNINAVADKSETISGYQNSGGGAVYKAGAQNGLSVARFDGINHSFAAASAVHHGFGSGDFYYIGALKNSGPSGAIGGIWDNMGTIGTPSLWIQKTMQVLGCYLNGYQGFSSALSTTSPQMIEFWRESGVVKAAVDGVLDATTYNYASAIEDDTYWRIGRLWSGSTYLFSGDMYEQLVYAGLPTPEERTVLRNYLDAKWAVF